MTDIGHNDLPELDRQLRVAIESGDINDISRVADEVEENNLPYIAAAVRATFGV